jgi:hypothetical protein
MSQTFQIFKGDIITSSSNGRPILTQDAQKLRQDVQEFFTVDVQPNGWGAGIEQLVGIVELSTDVFVSIADKQMRDGLDVFKALQNSELRIPRSLSERILSITGLQVDVSPTDPTTFFFRVNINTEGGPQIPLVQPIIGKS